MLRTQPGFACFRLRVTATNAKAVGCADDKGRQAHSRPLSFSPAVAFKKQNAAASSKGRAWAFRVMLRMICIAPLSHHYVAFL